MDELTGSVLGPCRLEGVIGQGAMGAVFRGTHLALDKPVAVKVLLDPETGREELLAEARATAKIDDPHIAQVYDAGFDAGYCYIVMQLIEGETLGALVKKYGPLAPERALPIMKQVALGLAAAHARGICHRDIKPANIMVTADDEVRILDFGLAALLGQAAQAAGTKSFMAPEQWSGAAPDPRQDLYAFAATYVYALTSRDPAAVEGPLPGCTRYASDMLACLLDRDPARRLSSAEAVLSCLANKEFLITTHGSGSPFVILPPPSEPARPKSLPPQKAAKPALELPPPPPAPPAPASDWAALPIFLGGWAIAFGPAWTRVSPADWPAAGVCAAAAAILWTPAALLLPLTGYGLLRGAAWSFETILAASLSGAAALAGGALSFGTKERLLGAALIAGGTAALAWSGGVELPKDPDLYRRWTGALCAGLAAVIWRATRA